MEWKMREMDRWKIEEIENGRDRRIEWKNGKEWRMERWMREWKKMRKMEDEE